MRYGGGNWGVPDRPIPSPARWAFPFMDENSPKRPTTILVFIVVDRDAEIFSTPLIGSYPVVMAKGIMMQVLSPVE